MVPGEPHPAGREGCTGRAGKVIDREDGESVVGGRRPEDVAGGAAENPARERRGHLGTRERFTDGETFESVQGGAAVVDEDDRAVAGRHQLTLDPARERVTDHPGPLARRCR